MANGGGKKKNKKDGEGKRKETEQERQKRELEEKRAQITAQVEAARMKQKEEMKQGASTSREKADDPMKKKGDGKPEGKRAEDNKRRDSMGGSVSTSSNSSGTDCDEVLSDATKSLVTSPASEGVSDSPTHSARVPIPIADAIDSIHQVANFVVEEATADAMDTLGDFLPYTVTKSKNKAGARNLAAGSLSPKEEKEEESVSPPPPPAPAPSSTTASPVPRKVPTPILTGGPSGRRSVHSPAEAAIFRPIDPEEMPAANVAKEREEAKEIEERRQQQYVVERLTSPEIVAPYRSGVRGIFPNYVSAQGNNVLTDIIRTNFVHQITENNLMDRLGEGYGDYNRRGEYYEREMAESVKDRPEAYLFPPPKGISPKDLGKGLKVKTEGDSGEGSWVAGERNVLQNVMDDVPKLLSRQKEPWIRDLLQMIFNGQFKNVYNRMRVMANVYMKEREEEEIKWPAAMRHVAATLVEAGTSDEYGYSFVHLLSSGGKKEKDRCEDRNGHRKCLVLKLILGALSPESLQRALCLKCTAWCGRTPIHFATATGATCQLAVLQEAHVNATLPDDYGMTPTLFATIRDYPVMLHQLELAGTDAMEVNQKTGMNVIDFIPQGKKGAGTRFGENARQYLQTRNKAMETALHKWFKEITTPFLRLERGISEVHILDCFPYADQAVEKININKEQFKIPHWIGHVSKVLGLKMREGISYEERAHMFLVLIPFTYLPAESSSPAEYPSIVRQTLFTDEEGRPKPVQFFTEPPFLNCKEHQSTRPVCQRAMAPLLQHPNTGSVWIYKVPSDVFAFEKVWANLALDLSKVDQKLREDLRLMAQVALIYPAK